MARLPAAEVAAVPSSNAWLGTPSKPTASARLTCDGDATYAIGIGQQRRGCLPVDVRHVRLFRNGRSQAIRIPKEFELPGSEATIARCGNHLVVRAVQGRSLLDVLDSMVPLDPEDALPDVDQTLLALDDPLAAEP